MYMVLPEAMWAITGVSRIADARARPLNRTQYDNHVTRTGARHAAARASRDAGSHADPTAARAEL